MSCSHRRRASKSTSPTRIAHWARGRNENTNGLIRQFFQKGTDLLRVSRRQIKHVQTLLNTWPRKVLNWRTPSEAFRNVPVALGT